MKKQSTSKALFVGAAVAGLLTGGLTAQVNAANAPAKSGAPYHSAVLADDKKGEDPRLRGQELPAKARGGCKTGDNGCAGKNGCKGKGGCATKNGKPVKGS